MQITIFKNFSKEINSTKQPSGGTAISCTLKEDTSLINPVFILQGADFEVNYVQWGSRYYYVNDIVSIRNGAVELHCTSDPMATFKANIGASSQYVLRSATASNNYLQDALYPLSADVDIQAVTFDTMAGYFNSNSYVIGVMGQNTGLGVDYYMMTGAEFASFINYLYGGTYLDAPTTEISIELQKEIANPLQYIVSAMWFPCTTFTGVQVSSIPFGFWDAPCRALRLTSLFQAYADTVTLPYHPQSINTDREYLYSNPYTQIQLDCFTFGSTPLDATWFSRSKLLDIAIGVDYATGTGELYILGRTSGGSSIRILTIPGQVGVPVQISQVNQNLIQSAVGLLGSAGAIAQGNFMGVISGVGDIMNGLLPQAKTVGSMASRVSYNNKPRATLIFHKISGADTVRNGKPLMENRTISALSGYTQCANVDIEIIGTPEEKNQIIGFMESGFYYE